MLVVGQSFGWSVAIIIICFVFEERIHLITRLSSYLRFEIYEYFVKGQSQNGTILHVYLILLLWSSNIR